MYIRFFATAQKQSSIISASVATSILLSNQRRSHCAGATAVVIKPTLYQYTICPFCNKVKAYLDYIKVDYDSIEVNPLTKSEIKFSKDYRKVPIALFGDMQLNESSDIIRHISDNILNTSAVKLNKSQFIPADTQKWDEWSEKKLAVMLYPNITRSMAESWECFGYALHISSWNPLEQHLVRAIGSVAMSFANGKIKSKYGIVDERKELFATLDVWCDAVASKPFLHGNHITLPDLMVYGVLRSIQGLSTFDEIMRAKPALQQWYERVAAVVNKK